MSVHVRAAVEADVPRVLQLVRDLAAYEREPDAVVATEDDLATALFGDGAVASCHVADVGGEVVGFALWFVNFSTWRGRPGLYLEDLYVDPAARRGGVARTLLDTLRRIAVERGYDRMDWSVLDWNTDAQAFYRALGARPQTDWTTWRLDLTTDRAGSPGN
jgi:GNAT superfamily N-acetyltransferase